MAQMERNKVQKSFASITGVGANLTDEKKAKNAFVISIGTAILLGVLLVLTVVFNRSFTEDPSALIALVSGTIVFGVSAWLSRRNKSNIAMLFNIFALSAIIVSRVFVQKGLSIQIGIVYIVLISAIAVYTLPSKWIGWTVIFSFVIASVTIIGDQFTTGLPLSTSSGYVTWISGIVGVIYMIAIAIRFPSFPLRTKLIVGFLFLTIIPLIILAVLAYLTTNDIVVKQIQADLVRSSLSTSAEFQESFLDPQFSIIRNQARTREIVEYMSLPAARRTSKEAFVYDVFETFSKTKPTYIRSYALLDNNGIDLLDTEQGRIGTSFAEHEFFTTVIENKSAYSSGLNLLPNGTQVIYFATPVTSESGEMVGVYLVTYNPNIIQSTVERMLRTNQAAPPTTEYTYIVDATNYFVLAHTTRVDLLYKSYLAADDARLVKLQEQGIISPERLSSLTLPQPEAIAELSKLEEGTINFQAPDYDAEMTESAAVYLSNSKWVVVTSQPVSTISNIIQAQTQTNVLVSVIITVIAALIALIGSNFFTSPIIQLTRVAENISAGDLTQKADIRRNDEIGVLGRTFNTMTDQIQGLVGNLEKRVEERTAQLAETTSQSEKRATDLQTIAEIARYISTEKDIESLLPLVARTVSERFGFYHVGIFLLNENRDFAVLRAANSLGGQAMLRRQHKLEVGFTGIVGNVTSTGVPRIALDTGADAVYFNNPDLPDTRSEMALPLIARGIIIGALDVQSIMSNAFTDTDVSIISLLADQVAIAIDNVRLLEGAQNALAESQSVFNQYLSEAWQKKSESSVIGYYQTITGGKVITADNNHTSDTTTNQENSTLAIPIMVRDHVIGTINIRPSGNNKTWNSDEVNIAQAITERLGLALDNARLFEETSTRASRERLVADITTRIRGTNDPQEMIKTAVEELQRALGATRVEIVPQKISPPSDK